MRWETAFAIALVSMLREVIYSGRAKRAASWTVAGVRRLLLTQEKREQRRNLLEPPPRTLRCLPPPASHHQLGE